MKSQSNQYPLSTIYDSNNIAIPVNITEITMSNNMGEETTQTGYSYDLIITPVENATNVFQNTKSLQLLELSAKQGYIQASGFVCSNGIKLQVDETSLIRWTQLMTGLAAFQPPTVSIRDYDNVVHDVSLSVASQMLAEVFLWGQTFLADTWTKKDAIINAG